MGRRRPQRQSEVERRKRWEKRKYERKKELSVYNWRIDGNRKSGCCELDVAGSLVRNTESSSGSSTSPTIHGSVTYGEKNVPVAVTGIKSPST